MENFFIEIFSGLWQVVAVILRAFSPLIIGLVLAYLFNGPTEWLRKKFFIKTDEPLTADSPKGRIPSIIMSYTLAALILGLVIYAFLILILGAFPDGGFYYTLKQVYEYFDSASEDIKSFIEKYVPSGMDTDNFNPASMISDWLEERFSLDKLLSTLSSFVGGIVNFFVGLVASVYLIKDKEFFLCLWQKLLSLILRQNVHGQVNETLSEINHVITTFIKGAMIDSLIVALLSSIALSAIKVKFSVIIGIIGGLLNIIPYFGPFFSMIPAFFVAFFSKGLGSAVLAVLVLFLIQQLDSNYIYPKIVGDSIGLHPLFVLISLTVLGYFGGIPGMLMAVPTAGIMQVLIKKWAYKY